MDKPGIGIKIGTSAETNVKEQGVNVNPPVKENMNNNIPINANEDLELPYTDMRSVTIALRPDKSYYRQVNIKALPKKVNYIGSSYNSSLILSSNKVEIETYFPSLLGIAPNNDKFITRVKQYLNNIQVPVDELGKTFDTSFRYNHKKDYLRIAREEEKIEERYAAVDRGNIRELTKALEFKIKELNELESSKCLLGSPVKLEDYILYRHCLLYNDVAKDVALINEGRNVRFYFKDDKREADKAKKLRLEIVKAKDNYIKCYNDDALFEAVYIQYCVLNNLPILSSLNEEKIEKELRLDKFSTDEPIKFNKICANKDCKLIGNIEKLIARGELVRIGNTQNITTSDGQFIGANMIEALAWFKNPDNTQLVTTFINKLNTI